MNNIEKTLKNSTISVIAQILSLLLQFVNRKVFVIFLDVEFLGYQSVFSNVFSLLSVAELGIGNIIAFQLYKEIVDHNTEEIGKLMYLYKWVYRVVAVIVLFTGILCNFFLPLFVTVENVSWTYLRLIYFLQLASIIAGYFLSYKRTIMIATQQEYRCVKIDLYVHVVIQIIQLTTLAVFKNYILYLCLQLSTLTISNILIARKVDLEFPFIKGEHKISKQEIRKRHIFTDMRNFLVHQVSYVIYGGTDNIIISAYCGIRNVALYGNYVLIRQGVMQVMFYKLLNPIQATIGNIVYSNRSKEDLWKQFQVFDVFSFYFATYIALGFWVFYQPTIQLWMGEEFLLSIWFVLLLSITTYFGAVWEIVYKYRTAFGDYKQDRNFMLLSAVLNIFISVIGAKYIGIEGVQLGTLIAFFPIAIGRIRFVVKNYFSQSMFKYIIHHLLLFVIVLIEGVICYFAIRTLPISVSGMLIRLLVWFIVPLTINTLVFYRNQYFRGMVQYLRRMFLIIKRKVDNRRVSNE